MPRKYDLNICRNGAIRAQYVIPTADSTAAGTYSCDITIKFISSARSAGYLVTAAGLLFHML